MIMSCPDVTSIFSEVSIHVGVNVVVGVGLSVLHFLTSCQPRAKAKLKVRHFWFGTFRVPDSCS